MLQKYLDSLLSALDDILVLIDDRGRIIAKSRGFIKISENMKIDTFKERMKELIIPVCINNQEILKQIATKIETELHIKLRDVLKLKNDHTDIFCLFWKDCHSDKISEIDINDECIWLYDILNSLNDGILVADRHCRVKLINKAYTRLKGYAPNEIVGRLLHEVRPAQVIPRVLKTGNPMIAEHRRVNGIEYVSNAFPITRDNEIIGAVTVSKDITEIRRLTSQLEKSRATIRTLHQKMGLCGKYEFKDIVGNDKELKKTIFYAKKAAQGDAFVLISGETGTGKELFAQAIHRESPRYNNPFIALNCAAIPPDLLESELFGYEEGAFSGARKGGKIGLFELADKGTLFLDDIEEMDYRVQAKLLRVLEQNVVRPLGGVKEREVDVRLIAATNRCLRERVSTGNFREDLYFRINVISLHIPPLRDRKVDIPLMARTFLSQISQKLNINMRLTDGALNALCTHYWPGNVRELKNAIEYSATMNTKDEIDVSDLPETIAQQGGSDRLPTLKETVKDAERQIIQRALNKHGRSTEGKKGAAQALGISLSTLYNYLEKIDI